MFIKAKKSLGQNFLIDQNLQQKIVDFCGITPADTVLEIGPGRGELTGRIVKTGAKKIYAVELDRALAAHLKQIFNGIRAVEIVQDDILKVDLEAMVRGATHIKVIGNIPYYITSPIIERIIKMQSIFSYAILTVQKEFAERIAATPGSKEYGSFSCFVQYYAQAKLLYTIKKSCFRPVPNVDSAVLSLEVRPWQGIPAHDEGALFYIIRTAFNQRRKTLRNSVRAVVAQSMLEEFFTVRHISPNARAEELSLDDFIALANLAGKTS